MTCSGAGEDRKATAKQGWRGFQKLNCCAFAFAICNLPRTTGMVAVHMQRLYAELAITRHRFRPHFWFAEEWFSPDGVPGIALPFTWRNHD